MTASVHLSLKTDERKFVLCRWVGGCSLPITKLVDSAPFFYHRYPACKCPPRYTGPHCEFLKEGYDDSTIATTRSHGSVLGIIVGLLVSGAVIIFVVLMMNRQRRRRRLNRQKTSMIEFAHINEQVETSPSMEELDFEDENMEEVELL